MTNPSDKQLKRRANILYRLRKKGIRVQTKQHTVFFEYGGNPDEFLQVRQLRGEYNFIVQFELKQRSNDN